MTLLAAIVVDVTLLLALALLATLALRRRSAAVRHLILAAALLTAALVPALELAGPQWSLPLLTTPATTVSSSGLRFTSEAATEVTADAAAVGARPATDWIFVASTIWTSGAVLGLAGLLTGLVRLRRLTSRCTAVAAGPWRELADDLARAHGLPRIALLQSAEPSVLVTFGTRRPRIVLPAGADSWTDARRRVVMAHEVEHIRRGDWTMHIVAEIVRSAYWFHPLAWLACRRLRHESECACDDAVLARGVDATEYATHLLDVARHAIGRRERFASAPAIAHPSTLERRIAAMLNPHRSRQPLTRQATALAAGAMLVIALPLTAATLTQDAAPSLPAPAIDGAPKTIAAVTPPATAPLAPAVRPAAAATPAVEAVEIVAQEKPASIHGTLYDQLGGVLPGAVVTLIDRSVGASYSMTSGRDGVFAFNDLQPATYELQARLPGFMIVSNVMSIGAGSAIERHITLPIGTLEETLRAVCQAGGAPSPQPRRVLNEDRPGVSAPRAAGAAPFSGGIGGQIKVPRKTRSANPICPGGAPAVDTVVRLNARVGIDGYVSDVRLVEDGAGFALDTAKGSLVVGSKPAPEFVESALDAVRLWQFTPTLLNGVPVEVPLSILISYTW